MHGCVRMITAPLALALLAMAAVAADVPGGAVGEGAVEIPFEMATDGQMSAAIYKPNGQMLRPLAQMVDVSKGKQVVRWDGLDLWGNPLPAGTEFITRVITNQGLKATYEFSVATPNAIPWISKTFGEGDAARTGGWLGDYAPPSAACAVGDRIFFSSTIADYGHTLIYTNIEGEKMWGGMVRGPAGPEQLTTDGKHVFALLIGRRVISQFDLDGRNAKVVVTLSTPAEGFAVAGGKLYITAPAAGKSLDEPGPLGLDIYDLTTGRLAQEFREPNAAMTRIAFAPDGKLYSLWGGKLCQSELGVGTIKHRVLNSTDLQEPISLTLDGFKGERIAVGDAKRGAVVVFDRDGKVGQVIGVAGPRKRGEWNENLVEKPTGITFDKNGKIWVVENVFAPKRITRFSAEGKPEKIFYGPPGSGGGGYLDPSLQRFSYNACEFELDFAKGVTTKLARLNDVWGDALSPALDESAYGYTRLGRPIAYQGRQYAVGDPGYQQCGGFIVCLLENGVFRPCAVMGPALVSGGKGAISAKTRLNAFLRKEIWREHWEKENLAKCSFIWCDRNGDGQFQTDEVEIVKDEETGGKPAFAGAYWGNRCGADLTFWGINARLAPSQVTDKGVPIYEKKALQPFDYAALTARYPGLKTVHEAISVVGRDGCLTVAGQPFQVTPEMKIRGGEVPTKPGTLLPPVLGEKYGGVSFVGTAQTNTPVGEVGVLNGANGVWYVVALRDSLLLSTIFTGKEGTWSGLAAERGMDVTHRRQEIDTGYGDFLRASDGKCYAVAGKGFHAICRVDGLEDYKVVEATRKMSEPEAEANKQVYSQMVAAAQGSVSRSRTRPTLECPPLDKRVKDFKLDGDIAEWGKLNKSPVMGNIYERYRFDAAYDAKGLYLAVAGYCGMGNASEDPKYLFKDGFGIDLLVRPKASEPLARVVEGDRRIVFGRHKGAWIAMLYDYVNPTAPAAEGFDFESQVAKTHVARVIELPKDKAQMFINEITGPKNKDGKTSWTAEIFVSWDTLGVKGVDGTTFKADVGVLAADSGGIQVERRAYWSNLEAEISTDPAIQAQVLPGTWGTIKLVK